MTSRRNFLKAAAVAYPLSQVVPVSVNAQPVYKTQHSRVLEFTNHFLKKRWFVIALTVGSLLNFINQYDALMGNAALHWPKLCLTYIVPYCVSSISAWYQ